MSIVPDSRSDKVLHAGFQYHRRAHDTL